MITKDETIHVAWVHHGVIDNGFAISVLDLVTKASRPLTYNAVHGLGLLSKSRNILVKHFLDNTTDPWLFMVDGDEFITLAAFEKLANAADAEKAPIISGLVFGSRSPVDIEPSPCIFVYNDNQAFVPYYKYPEDKVVQIAAAGGGALLVHRSVLEAIREKQQEYTGPDWAWFQDGPTGTGSWLSEDLMFSLRVAEAGFKMHAHTGAVFPHHKELWLTDKHYKQFTAEPGA
jgi:hypothetical protein